VRLQALADRRDQRLLNVLELHPDLPDGASLRPPRAVQA
jgi:hypothetical protein